MAKVYTISAMSKPQSKKGVSHLYRMAFVTPSQMPEEFIAQRVKGTGKPATMPAGMSLVWSITHDAWRVFNLDGALTLSTEEFEVDTIEYVTAKHKAYLETLTPEERVTWGLEKPAA